MTERICPSLPSLALRAQGKPWAKIPRPPWERTLRGRRAAGLRWGEEVQLQTAPELGPRGEVCPFLVELLVAGLAHKAALRC